MEEMAGKSWPSSYCSSSRSSGGYVRHEVRTITLTLVEALESVIAGALDPWEFYAQAPVELKHFLDESSRAVFGFPFTGLDALSRRGLLQGLLEAIRREQHKAPQREPRREHGKWLVPIAVLACAIGLAVALWWIFARN